ncbi:MAG TPA: Clp protease N-terminal domain-containing protein [Gemmatimonadaceae bacterium]
MAHPNTGVDMNGYNFTARVRKVLAIGRDEASRLHHEYVGTEHILLGLIREGEGVGATVLQNLSVNFDDIQQKVEETVKKGKADTTTGPDLPYTSRAKKVLELAMAEARELNHSYVGTEHLLIGLLRDEKGIAAMVLKSRNVTVDRARAEVVRLVGTTLPIDPGPKAAAGVEAADRATVLTALARGTAASRKPRSYSIDIVSDDGGKVQGRFTSVWAALRFLLQN